MGPHGSHVIWSVVASAAIAGAVGTTVTASAAAQRNANAERRIVMG